MRVVCSPYTGLWAALPAYLCNILLLKPVFNGGDCSWHPTIRAAVYHGNWLSVGKENLSAWSRSKTSGCFVVWTALRLMNSIAKRKLSLIYLLVHLAQSVAFWNEGLRVTQKNKQTNHNTSFNMSFKVRTKPHIWTFLCLQSFFFFFFFTRPNATQSVNKYFKPESPQLQEMLGIAGVRHSTKLQKIWIAEYCAIKKKILSGSSCT